ncbi:MAG: MBL fold metallo-hydrolase [Bacilli bacterium]|nr:MBL fold metallo-hydrolase [Bacilli bacterium]MDD4795004.1 MBL fold metallo-hydrolase [Bacilli bacterium]
MKLKKLGDKTYIIDSHNKVGIYLINKTDVAIIDTGLSDSVGKEIMEICNSQNWQIKMILNTHSHPDHIGGNHIIQEQLKVKIYAPKTEKIFIENPELTSIISYGGNPHKYLNNPYLVPKASVVNELSKAILPEGLEYFNLPGHNSEMVGFKTSDDIYFLADAVAGEDIIKKHELQFIYDIQKYFETLDFIKSLDGKLFVPSHGENFIDNKFIVKLNYDNTINIINYIKKICFKKATFETILKNIFETYNLKMDFIQYSFISLTIKGYLTYMLNNDMLKVQFTENEQFWITL